jgi:quercetin dioxygenase-like cupin family protein
MDGSRDAPAFMLRAVSVAPGAERAYDEHEWRDALVAVTGGEIELEWLSGTSHRFGRGDLLCLSGLRLRALSNPGREPALLVAVSRR